MSSITEASTASLHEVPHRQDIYVNGAWQPSAGSGRIDVVDPATERVIATVPAGHVSDVDAAVRAARGAAPVWAGTSPAERARLLRVVADGLDRRAEEIAQIICAELGCPIQFVRARHVPGAIFHFRSAADIAEATDPAPEQIGNSMVVREPYGVVAAITPWNYPLVQIAAKVAFGLGAGNTIVLKPSEVTPLCVYVLAEVIDAAGLPPGSFNLLIGDGPTVGEALVSHPDVDLVSFTGSTAVGRRIGAIAASSVKRVTLELGGKSPTLVMPGADVRTAATRAITSLARNTGQTCAAQTRLIVERARLGEVEEALVEASAAIRVGDPHDEQTEMGPVVSARQYDRVRGYIEQGVRDGARLVTGGLEAPDNTASGYFVRPTVFSEVTPEMSIRTDEIFGPVLVIEVYDTLDEAIALANASIYGLSAGVWGADRDSALQVARQLQAGQVQVNGAPFNDLAPFGGYKQSGNGREFGVHGFAEFQELKSIQL
jgi:aldehyde dehydrogenase (NAD+)